MDSIPGRATAEGTRRFQERAVARGRIPAAHFRGGPDGVALSSIGLGTYLGPADGPTDASVEEAVVLAAGSGRSNVVDTAINYRYQRAERSVGRAVRRLVDRGSVARDEIFLCSKNGYLAPDAESGVAPAQYLETELFRRGVLRRSEVVDGSHAMSRSFLEDQFARSLRNLGIGAIDLMYLHNAPDAELPVLGRTAFLPRLREAFALYESFRKDGRLGWYGLATWDSLRSPHGDPSHLDVEDAVRIAEEVGGSSHGFRFLQFPFNLSMPEPAVVRSQTVRGARRTLFEAARELGLTCFTSVPLLQGELARGPPGDDGLTAAQTALQFARSAPGTLGPLVGQKSPEHLSENLRVAELAPWDEARFRSLL
ncbi:MAG TPA: aldo/keto reductase [Thermoplasmata archaeon]|nr:aldo/keto reductase [Thermoplasmata archaeon]